MMNLKLIIEIPVDGEGTKTTRSDITQHTEELRVLIENWCRNINSARRGEQDFFGPPIMFKFMYDHPDPHQGQLNLEFED